MSFKITIEEVVEETRHVKEWKKVADSGNKEDNGAVYGYVYSDDLIDKERTLYTQTTETLDLATVIRAVNGL